MPSQSAPVLPVRLICPVLPGSGGSFDLSAVLPFNSGHRSCSIRQWATSMMNTFILFAQEGELLFYFRSCTEPLSFPYAPAQPASTFFIRWLGYGFLFAMIGNCWGAHQAYSIDRLNGIPVGFVGMGVGFLAGLLPGIFLAPKEIAELATVVGSFLCAFIYEQLGSVARGGWWAEEKEIAEWVLRRGLDKGAKQRQLQR
jgi:hypothetical protein